MASTPGRAGRLLLVPNTLDLGAAESDAPSIRSALPDAVLEAAAALAHWAVEDARSARRFLKRVAEHHPLAAALQDLSIVELPRPRKGSREAVPAAEWHRLLAPALAGHDIGLLSEAGLPAVADPGALLVAAAHRAEVPVVPLAGPSSLLLALAASGLNGQSFAFVGYLPQDAAARTGRIRELEQLSRRTGQTQLFIETPYRNATLLHALLAVLAEDTQLSVSAGLTMPQAFTRSARVGQWRHKPSPIAADAPAVFALLAA
jgi:16S rRNA (cytidine1402-2'-O)-methyltransferase